MTAKTRSDLNTQADTDLADNTTGDITPADVRTIVKDIADSARLAEDLGTAAGMNITVSTSNPSGGVDGDIWLKVQA